MCSPDLDIICPCCQEDIGGHCPSCRHAVGLHRCHNRRHDWGDVLKWKKGTLYLGPTLDPQRNIFNLHRKNVPTDALQNTCQNYVENGYMTSEVARRILQVIEQERGQMRLAGDASSSTDTPVGLDAPAISPKMSVREMEAELSKREAMMRADGGPGETDQWRSERKTEYLLSVNVPCRCWLTQAQRMAHAQCGMFRMKPKAGLQVHCQPASSWGPAVAPDGPGECGDGQVVFAHHRLSLVYP